MVKCESRKKNNNRNGTKKCLQFLLGVKMAPRETENNAYAKLWGDKQRALMYVMVFSGVVNYKLGFNIILYLVDLEFFSCLLHHFITEATS